MSYSYNKNYPANAGKTNYGFNSFAAYLAKEDEKKKEIPPYKPESQKKTLTPFEKMADISKNITEGARIKQNVGDVLTKNYPSGNYKGIFDGIDEKKIESNISLADDVIKKNTAGGAYRITPRENLPWLHDGLALFYASAEQGDSKAANAARTAAYTEEKQPEAKSSDDIPDFFGNALKRFEESVDNKPEKVNCGFTTMTDSKHTATSSGKDNPLDINKESKNSNVGLNFSINPYLDFINHPQSFLQRNNSSTQNNSIKKSLIALPDEVNSNTVYYGNIHGRGTAEDMEYSDKQKNDITHISWFTTLDFIPSEEQHLNNFKNFARFLTTGEMQVVLEDMISHFADGTGTQYRNAKLTEMVKKNKVTQAFMKDFSNVFDNFMKKYKGDFSSFAFTKEFRDALVDNKVLLSTYDYGYDNLQNGLMLAIHSWSKSRVDVKNLTIMEDGIYVCTLEFTFSDNFGLDEADIDKFGALPGFRSWYILQHYGAFEERYKPFETVVTIDYSIKGFLSEEK